MTCSFGPPSLPPSTRTQQQPFPLTDFPEIVGTIKESAFELSQLDFIDSCGDSDLEKTPRIASKRLGEVILDCEARQETTQPRNSTLLNESLNRQTTVKPPQSSTKPDQNTSNSIGTVSKRHTLGDLDSKPTINPTRLHEKPNVELTTKVAFQDQRCALVATSESSSGSAVAGNQGGG